MESLVAAPEMHAAVITLLLCSIAMLLALLTFIVDRLQSRVLHDRAALRGRVCIAIPRVLFAAVVLATLYPGFALILRYVRHGPDAFPIASKATDRWMYEVVVRSVSTASNNTFDPKENALGVGTDLVAPDRPRDPPRSSRVGWAVLLSVVCVVSGLGAATGIFAEKAYVKKGVFVLMVVQLLLWLVVSVTMTYLDRDKVRFATFPIVNTWADKEYSRSFNKLYAPPIFNETRLLRNWFIKVRRKRNTKTLALSTFPGMDTVFCQTFNSFLPGASDTNDTSKYSDENVGDSAVNKTTSPGSRNGTSKAPSKTPLPFDDSVSFAGRSGRQQAFPKTSLNQTDGSAEETPDAVGNDDEEPGQGKSEGSDANSEPRPAISDEPATATPGSTAESVAETEEDATHGTNDNEDPVPSDEPSEPDDNERSGADLYGDPRTLGRKLLGEVLMTYFIGKPLSMDHYRGFGYLALPVLTVAPAFVAQALHRWYLAPLVLPWLAFVTLLAVIGTPSALRYALVPVEKSQMVQFCSNDYRVLVVSRGTRNLFAMDRAIVALVAIAAFFRAFSWLLVADEAPEKNRRSRDSENFVNIGRGGYFV